MHDTRQVFDDQLSAVANDSRRWGTTGEVPDLALLVDGLQAEREQGITIDVAYRYFQTPRRKFIVADCPGHEQYTRNMATGASTADAAVVLVDAEKGVRVQTRRHTHIVSLLGVQNVILAVNKMDRIAYDKARFEAIAAEFVTYARKLGVQNIEVIPVAALAGVNVVVRGTKETPWYTGRTLLEALEGIEAGRTDLLKELRFPIQLVSRPDANFRGYAGTIASGEIAVGDAVLALPSRKSSKVREITTADGPLQHAGTSSGRDRGARRRNRSVARRRAGASRSSSDAGAHLRRESHLDGRGAAAARQTLRIQDRQPLREGPGRFDPASHRRQRPHDPRSRSARSQRPCARAHRSRRAGRRRRLQAVARHGLLHHRRPAALRYRRRRHGHRADARRARSTDVVWQPTRVTAATRANQKSQRPAVVWFTGLSGSGKSTIANALEQALVQRGHHSYLLDGDNMRHGLNKDLDFSEAGRNENIRRIGEVSALFVDAGLIVITAFISPFRADRNKIRERIGDAQFIEVYLSTSLEECERRDPKGLYVKARAGEIREFTGIDSPYEPPIAPQLTIDTSKQEIGASIDQLLRYLENKGFLHQADPGL